MVSSISKIPNNSSKSENNFNSTIKKKAKNYSNNNATRNWGLPTSGLILNGEHYCYRQNHNLDYFINGSPYPLSYDESKANIYEDPKLFKSTLTKPDIRRYYYVDPELKGEEFRQQEGIRLIRGDINEHIVIKALSKLFCYVDERNKEQKLEILTPNKFSYIDSKEKVDLILPQVKLAFQIKGCLTGAKRTNEACRKKNLSTVNTLYVVSWNETGPFNLLKCLMLAFQSYPIRLKSKINSAFMTMINANENISTLDFIRKEQKGMMNFFGFRFLPISNKELYSLLFSYKTDEEIYQMYKKNREKNISSLAFN